MIDLRDPGAGSRYQASGEAKKSALRASESVVFRVPRRTRLLRAGRSGYYGIQKGTGDVILIRRLLPARSICYKERGGKCPTSMVKTN